MIVAFPNLTPVQTGNPSRQRRNAFTLLEVLVVVAILVVLASVASIAVFKYLEDSYSDKARMDMQTLEQSFKTLVLRNAGSTIDQSNFNMQMLTQNIDQGSAALIDPWGKPYQYRFLQGENGDERIQFFTTDKKGNEIKWPVQ